MRTIAFGYSDRCNIRCSHCVAADDTTFQKMDLGRARQLIGELAAAGVRGISFTAGEPFIYFDDLLQLLELCRKNNIYSRVVSNSFWAATRQKAGEYLEQLKLHGLCQLRLSYSRWHQQHVPAENIVHAARACQAAGIDCYVSFVTDFTAQDDDYETFLREKNLKFFPEPVIYSGRAQVLEKRKLHTDYQENRCTMNPYLAPDLSLYGCCDAGVQFAKTNFFYLGNLAEQPVEELLHKSENMPLYNCIRSMGITTIASFAGMPAREIISYRKCDLCRKLFDSPEMLEKLEKQAAGRLRNWRR